MLEIIHWKLCKKLLKISHLTIFNVDLSFLKLQIQKGIRLTFNLLQSFFEK